MLSRLPSNVSITLCLHPPPPIPSPLSFSMGTTDVRVTPLAVPELSKRSESFLISPLNYAYGYQFGCFSRLNEVLRRRENLPTFSPKYLWRRTEVKYLFVSARARAHTYIRPRWRARARTIASTSTFSLPPSAVGSDLATQNCKQDFTA